MLENAWQPLPTSVKPGTQTLHTLADEQKPQFDTPHEAVHAVAPTIVLVDPVGHMEHAVAPGNALYEPAAHGKQEPWAKYSPALHVGPLGGLTGPLGKHADAPTELVDPVGQGVQDVTPEL